MNVILLADPRDAEAGAVDPVSAFALDASAKVARLLLDLLRRADCAPDTAIEYAPGTMAGAAILDGMRSGYFADNGPGLARITATGRGLLQMAKSPGAGIGDDALVQMLQCRGLGHELQVLAAALELRPYQRRLARRLGLVERMLAAAPWVYLRGGFRSAVDVALTERAQMRNASVH